MKVFDSSLKAYRAWSGNGITIKSDNLIISQSASAHHPMILNRGRYFIKLIAKRRSGNGAFSVGVLDSGGKFTLRKNISITKNSWTEFSFFFDIDSEEKHFLLKIIRERGSFGTVEISRIVIEKDSDIVQKPSKKGKKNRKLVHSPPKIVAQARKRVAVVIPYKIYGGAEVYLKNLIPKVDKDLFDFVVLHLNRNPILGHLEGSNVQHKIVGSINRLSANLVANDYDIVLYYNSKKIYDLLTRLFDDGSIKSRLMEVYHSDFTWSDALANHPERKWIDTMFVVSKDLALNIKGLKKERRVLLPVPIDTDKFINKLDAEARDELGIPPNALIVGTVARLSREKNIDYVLDIAKELTSVYFVIIGDGPDGVRLNKRIRGEKLFNVKLVGFKKDVEKYYNSLDAFLLTSKMEGTPVSILEAMSCGLTVFSTDVGSISSILKEGETGFFLSGNVIDDAMLIKRHITDIEMGQAARRFVVDNHKDAVVAKKFVETVFDLGSYYKEAPKDMSGWTKIAGEYV